MTERTWYWRTPRYVIGWYWKREYIGARDEPDERARWWRGSLNLGPLVIGLLRRESYLPRWGWRR